ncbi:MAG: L,D-transpeptidase [Acidobacteriota bacterium]
MPSRFATRVIMISLVAAMCAVALSQTSDRPRGEVRMRSGLQSPEIIIRKKQRALEVYDSGKLIKAFTIVLGFEPVGDKEVEGDGKTPEGEFYVFTKNAKSKFHLSLGLSYPSKKDAERGLAKGLISKLEHGQIFSAIDKKQMPPQKTALGGEIYIHGGGTRRDWTWGCVALDNDKIEELFRATPLGTKVTITP